MDQQMRYFIAVVDEHNFTRAAADCHISQSAISQQIKELESNLGVTLLQRQGRSFTVTPAGEYFYHHAKEIVAAIDRLAANTRQLVAKQQEEYVLHLGYLTYFGTQEFLQAVAAFSQRYPNVRVKIKNGTHEALFDLLRHDQIDLNFSDQWRALSNEYRNEFLTETDLVAVVPLSDFPGQEEVTTAELADRHCLLIVGDTDGKQEAAYARDVLGIKSPFINVANYEEAQAQMAAGQGFAIYNSRTQDQVNRRLYKALPLYNGQNLLRQKYYAYWKKDNSGYYIEAFAEELKKQFEK